MEEFAPVEDGSTVFDSVGAKSGEDATLDKAGEFTGIACRTTGEDDGASGARVLGISGAALTGAGGAAITGLTAIGNGAATGLAATGGATGVTLVAAGADAGVAGFAGD